IRIGSGDVLLNPGRYRYEIVYTTRFQIDHSNPDFDELYWNATGNGWDFAIEQATATVTLPEAVNGSQIKTRVFTGPDGSVASAATIAVDETTGTSVFTTTGKLEARSGLTVVVGFPKGLVSPPTESEIRSLYLWANLTIWLGLFSV